MRFFVTIEWSTDSNIMIEQILQLFLIHKGEICHESKAQSFLESFCFPFGIFDHKLHHLPIYEWFTSLKFYSKTRARCIKYRIYHFPRCFNRHIKIFCCHWCYRCMTILAFMITPKRSDNHIKCWTKCQEMISLIVELRYSLFISNYISVKIFLLKFKFFWTLQFSCDKALKFFIRQNSMESGIIRYEIIPIFHFSKTKESYFRWKIFDMFKCESHSVFLFIQISEKVVHEFIKYILGIFWIRRDF